MVDYKTTATHLGSYAPISIKSFMLMEITVFAAVALELAAKY